MFSLKSGSDFATDRAGIPFEYSTRNLANIAKRVLERQFSEARDDGSAIHYRVVEA